MDLLLDFDIGKTLLISSLLGWFVVLEVLGGTGLLKQCKVDFGVGNASPLTILGCFKLQICFATFGKFIVSEAASIARPLLMVIFLVMGMRELSDKSLETSV